MKKTILTVIVILAGIFYSCKDPYADNSYIKNESALPAASYMAQSDSLNVSMWVELLKYTDLFNTLNLSASYTCFIPDNEAVKSYLTLKGVSKITDLNVADATTLVKYHTIKGALYSAISFENGVLPDSTASGDYLASSFDETSSTILINTEGAIKRSLKTPNAYIHIINKVLTPVTETVWEKIKSSDFSIFREAVQKTGYDVALNTISQTINGVTYKNKFTMFAVPDSVYKANKISNFSVLVDSLKAGSDYTASTNKLFAYVGYHLLGQTASFATLSKFTNDSTKTQNYNTLAEDQLVNVSEINKLLYLNYNATAKKGVKLLAVNKTCKNGVVHIIDGSLPVQAQKSAKYTWEFTDYSLLSALIPKYRTAGLTSDYLYALSNPAIITSYKWATVPEGRTGLAYYVASKNTTEAYKAVNYDYLLIGLGQYGWVEMQTATIIAGKYSVTLGHYNWAAATQRAKIMFIVDGVYFGSQIATAGASTSKSTYVNTTKIGEITFTTSAKHTVRILSMDDYSSDLDCLIFTPL